MNLRSSILFPNIRRNIYKEESEIIVNDANLVNAARLINMGMKVEYRPDRLVL